MNPDEPASGTEMQEQIDALREQLAVTRGDIDALLRRADASSHRADASEAREETARLGADASEALADKDRLRIDDLRCLDLCTNGALEVGRPAQAGAKSREGTCVAPEQLHRHPRLVVAHRAIRET